mgnify:CR=1 FL=1
MKRIMKIAAVAFVVFLGSSWRSTASAQTYDDNYYNDGGNYDNNYNDNYDQYQQPQQDVDYQTFYDELSPHGRWVQHPQYGYVWIPNLGNDFRPYSTSGHWVWTDNYEWMWVSDYDWGWAPFHYGRWYSDPYYGWAWVPGYEWSPAWVAWRDGGDYYGWAPIQPGINISIGFNIGSYSPPYDYWCFTPRRYITSPRVYDYYLDRRQNVTIINQTTIINNFNYNRNVFRTGPRRADVEIYAGRITPVRFAPSSRPGRSVVRNNQVNIYRPTFNRNNSGRASAPRNFERYDRQRTASNGRGNNDRGNNRTFDRNNNNNNDNNGRVRNGNNLPRPERNGNMEGRNRERTANDNPFNRQRNADVNNRPDRRQDNPNREMRTPTERPQRNMDNPGRQRAERPDQPVRQPNENRVFRQERPQTSQPQVREQRQQQPQVREQRQPQVREQRQMPQQQQQPQRQFERRSNTGGGGEMRGGGNGGGRRDGRQ